MPVVSLGAAGFGEFGEFGENSCSCRLFSSPGWANNVTVQTSKALSVCVPVC